MSANAAADRRTETIPEWKQDEVAALVDFLESYESIGVVDVTGIPSRQLQAMRADLHGSAQLRMSRNTLLERALQDVDDGLETLVEYLTGQVGLIGTNDNPFGLYRQLEASKTPAPIGAGEVAPNDIVIPEGDTGMDPGPFVGELQAVGAQAQIMEGSIKVTAESTVAEAGDVVEDRLANVLAELGIEPKEVGLDLRGVYSDGVLFEAEELAIDVDEYRDDVSLAATRARNLAVEAAIPTAGSIGLLLGAASGDATALGVAAAVEAPELADDLVRTADARVRALAARLPAEALPEELQDVEPAPAPEPATEEPADDQPDDDPETEEADEPAPDESDDDDVSGEGLGDLFG